MNHSENHCIKSIFVNFCEVNLGCRESVTDFVKMSQLYHEFGVTLQRHSSDEPWGIRLAGGSDLNSPLIIIRVRFLREIERKPWPFISAILKCRTETDWKRTFLYILLWDNKLWKCHQRWLSIKINVNPIHDALWCNFNFTRKTKEKEKTTWKFNSKKHLSSVVAIRL